MPTTNIKSNYNTSPDSVKTDISGKTFDDFFLIVKNGDDITVWGSGNEKDASELLTTYADSVDSGSGVKQPEPTH